MLLVLVSLGLGGAAYAAVRALMDHEALDEATLCPASGPDGALIVLLDLTDPLALVQADRLRRVLTDRIAALPPGTLVSIGAVSSDPAGRGPRLSLCRPASGSTANALTQNATLMDRRLAERFDAPIEALLSEATAAEEQPDSPIIESLQALVVGVEHSGATDLLIVSDLLQNSPVLSAYRGDTWETLAARGDDARMGHGLAGARADILRIPRPSVSRDVHAAAEAFWTRYLDRQGVAGAPRVAILGDL